MDRLGDLWDAFLAESTPRQVEHVTLALLLAYGTVKGIKNFSLSKLIAAVPGGQAAMNKVLESEVDKSVKEMFPDDGNTADSYTTLPEKGLSQKEVLSLLQRLQAKDAQANGKAWAYMYKSNPQHYDTVTKAFTMYMYGNALNPTAFPTLRKMEVEIIAMAGKLLGGDDNIVGSLTSGGTESILCAIKTYREMARDQRPHITKPNIIVPQTIHPAFEKAGHYFDVEMIHVPIDPVSMRADIKAMEAAINSNTIAMVVSAPQYPHGVIDPVAEAGEVATRHSLPLHVDCCVGGYFLPFLERIGRRLPKWNFAVPAVTSISADIHKYGYAAKGASTVLYRSADIRKYQYFAYGDWPGGLFVSPSMTGTRGGGPIAAAYASLLSLGQDGFAKLCQLVMDTTDYLAGEIAKIEGLKILGKPDMSIISFISTDKNVNIYAIADVLEKEHGWKMERQQYPPSIHLSVTPPHADTKEVFIADLKKSIATVSADPSWNKEGTAAMYGMVGKIPDGAIVEQFLTTFMGKVYHQ